MNLLIIYILWLLFGLIALWFQATWYTEKYGRKFKDLFFENMWSPGSVIFTVMSGGILWPLIYLNFLYIAEKCKPNFGTKRNYNPFKWLHSKMVYVVRELQDPRENV